MFKKLKNNKKIKELSRNEKDEINNLIEKALKQQGEDVNIAPRDGGKVIKLNEEREEFELDNTIPYAGAAAHYSITCGSCMYLDDETNLCKYWNEIQSKNSAHCQKYYARNHS